MFYLLILLLQMKLIRHITDLNKAIKNNQNLGFVPTMGGLHKDHESLIKKSLKKCDKTLVSIFVNPKQFNSSLDYKSYPRNLNKDIRILKKLKVDFVFMPSVNEIYSYKKNPKFKLNKTDKILCAKFRKGHFEGVLDIMNRFIDLIMPKYIFMGEKDFQQLFLVKKYFKKKYNSKIVMCSTIRDKNKVALSSRNYLLDVKDLNIAGFISKILIKFKIKLRNNKKKNNLLVKNIKKEIVEKYKVKIDYLEVRNVTNLKTNLKNKRYKIFIAYFLNKIRLIDNF